MKRMKFLGASNCVQLLFDHIASSKTMKLQDPRAKNWPSVIGGALLVDRSHDWASMLSVSEPVRNSPIMILMRLGVESSSLLLGALQAWLFPILMKPSTPITQVVEDVRDTHTSLVAVPFGMLAELEKFGFLRVGQYNDFAILRSPYPSTPHPLTGNGPLIGILSSGSTGRSKVIVHTLDRVLHNGILHARSIQLSADDMVALALPLNFSAGLIAGLFSTLSTEASGIFLDSQKINPRRVLKDIRASVCMSTPATVMSLYDNATLSQARIVTVGGDAMNHRLASTLIDICGKDTKLYSTYGMTEAGPRISSSLITAITLEQYNGVPIGRPLKGVRLHTEIIDAKANAVELYVSTPTAMHGYLNQPLESLAVQEKPFGIIRTGDIFNVVNSELVFAARSGRLIVRGGENIYPAAIETAILKYLDVDDVWVTAEPDEVLGEIPKAYLVGNRESNLSHITRTMRKALPSSHVPAIWENVERLPVYARK